MGRRSKIDQLPAQLRDLVNELVRGGRTIEEITAHLRGLDAEVSRSSVGRYVKTAREQMETYQQAQQVAGQWVTQLTEQPQGDVSALLIEMLKTISFQLLSQIQPDETGRIKVKSGDIMFLAKALKDLEATTSSSLERRKRHRQAVLEEAAKAAGAIGKRAGLSDAAIAQIEQELRLL